MVLQGSSVGQTVLEATCPAEGRCVFCRVPPGKTYYSGEASFSGDGNVCAHSALASVRVCCECKSKGGERTISVDRPSPRYAFKVLSATFETALLCSATFLKGCLLRFPRGGHAGFFIRTVTLCSRVGVHFLKFEVMSEAYREKW